MSQVIEELDEKKKEALKLTWEKVNRDFGAIFASLLGQTSAAKLVPPEGQSFLQGALPLLLHILPVSNLTLLCPSRLPVDCVPFTCGLPINPSSQCFLPFPRIFSFSCLRQAFHAATAALMSR